MDDFSFFSFHESDQSKEGIYVCNSHDRILNKKRESISSDDLSYYTPNDSFDKHFSFNDSRFISDDDEICYRLFSTNDCSHPKRVPSPILPVNDFCIDNSIEYENDIEQYITNDSEVFEKVLIQSFEDGILDKSFLESSSSDNENSKLTHDIDTNYSDNGEYDVLKTGNILSIMTQKKYKKMTVDNSSDTFGKSQSILPTKNNLKTLINQNDDLKEGTSSEDELSYESSSSEDSDIENKNKYFVKVERNDDQIIRRPKKIPENINFENISLREARLLMEYLNDDYSGRRPRNVEYFFSKYLFKRRGSELMQKCFNIFNKYCFGNLLPDSIKLDWNKYLCKTAGTTSYSSKKGVIIVLSDKVCNKPYRVRDTLIHEMCHAASFLIDKVLKDGHGPSFKKWAAICSKSFPKMPKVSRCHNYNIESKYHYICEGCQQTVKRHSKSLNTLKKVCGKCRGKFILHVNGKKVTTITVEKDKEINVLSELLNKSTL